MVPGVSPLASTWTPIGEGRSMPSRSDGTKIIPAGHPSRLLLTIDFPSLLIPLRWNARGNGSSSLDLLAGPDEEFYSFK